MIYLEYSFNKPDIDLKQEVFIALLNEEGYEGFLESDDYLKVYLPENLKDEIRLSKILNQISDEKYQISYSCTLIPEKNWTEQWESDFQPIEIDDEVRIRASFHDLDKRFNYDLLIDPKMSFGTGHHSTTRLMIRAMLEHDFNALRVLDMGCGTGVLGILASKMGASSVIAIDIDEWSYRNSLENVKNNLCANIEVYIGNIDQALKKKCDIILANINRNVLLADMTAYYNILDRNGVLILSGIMEHDLKIILESARKNGFLETKVFSENQWHSLILNKS
jgi:ribosomal protein L11 methyltransferase